MNEEICEIYFSSSTYVAIFCILSVTLTVLFLECTTVDMQSMS